MAKQFLVSTTGAGTVTIDDLGGRPFTHPVVSENMAEEFDLEELRDSEDLRDAIIAGDLTADFDGQAITNAATFDAAMVDFDTTQTQANTVDITQLKLDVEALEKGGRRLRTVIDYVDNTAVPPTEVLGDRYIIDDTGSSNAAWDGAAALDLVEFNGTTWDVIPTEEGDVAYVDAENLDRVLVDDGSPAWEQRTGAFNQTAVQVPYTPTTAADWDVVPTEVGGALDELADRVEDLENAPAVIKKSITWAVGENGNISGDRDLKKAGGATTFESPFIAPVAGTIWGISIVTKQGTNISCNIDIIKNGSSIHTEALAAVDKKTNNGLALALVVGDEIRIRFDHTGTNVRDLGVEVFFIES